MKVAFLMVIASIVTLAMGQAPGIPSSLIQPGDVLKIVVVDQPQFSEDVTVLSDGTITGTGFSAIPVGGKSLADAKALVTQALRKILRDPAVSVIEKTSHGQFVYAVGMAQPGPVPFTPGMTVRQLLGLMQLPPVPSALDATLSRTDGTSLHLNLDQLLHSSDRSENIPLQPGDVLLVSPKARLRIWVEGFVNKPGQLQVESGTDPYQAIAEAGGVLTTSDAIKAGAFSSDQIRIEVRRGDEVMKLPVEESGRSAVKLENNDVISVVTPPVIHVTVAGFVNAPGSFITTTNSSIQSVVADAKGVLPEGTLTTVSVVRGADVYRVNATIPPGRKMHSFRLHDGDLVYVQRNENAVYVLGDVNKPGRFDIPDGEHWTASAALAKAGGLDPQGTLRRVVLVRPDANGKLTMQKFNLDEFLKSGHANANPALKPGDILYFGTPKGITIGTVSQFALTAFYLSTIKIKF